MGGSGRRKQLTETCRSLPDKRTGFWAEPGVGEAVFFDHPSQEGAERAPAAVCLGTLWVGPRAPLDRCLLPDPLADFCRAAFGSCPGQGPRLGVATLSNQQSGSFWKPNRTNPRAPRTGSLPCLAPRTCSAVASAFFPQALPPAPACVLHPSFHWPPGPRP